MRIMISRKERRLQKALGTEDSMPLTIRKRVLHWYWQHITVHTYKWTIDEFWGWLAYKLPKKLVWHATIRLWPYATTCPSGCNEIAGDTTVENAIKRWEKK